MKSHATDARLSEAGHSADNAACQEQMTLATKADRLKQTDKYSIPLERYNYLVDSLYQEGRSLLIGAAVSITAMLACFFKTLMWPFAVLAFVFAVVVTFRYLEYLRYQKMKRELDGILLDADRWETSYTAGATTSMALLGIWCFASFAVGNDPFVQLLSFTITMGYSVGILGRNFGVPLSVTLQALVTWIPMAGALAIYGDVFHWLFAALLGILFIAFKFIADRLRAMLLEAIEGRHRTETALRSAKKEAAKAKAARARAVSLLARLRQSRKREQAAIETRDQHMRFLATMSHEIRTPLNGIVGALDIMSGATSEKVPELISVASGSADALLEIVSEVLDLARLEYGDDGFQPQSFKIAELVNMLVLALTPIAKQKGVAFKTFIDPSLPERVIGDPRLIRQVLMNLTGNALKFTEVGSVSLSWQATGFEGDRVATKISLQDTGVGIPQSDIKEIYSPYFTSGNGDRRVGQSSGLGLTIAKKAVEKMNGTIKCESAQGIGTTFSVELQLRIDVETAEPIGAESEVATRSVSKARILLVEDNDTNAMLVEDMLESTPYVVRRAHGGLEGVEMALTQPYDLILMDISMPDLDGVEAFKRIRAGREGASRPKIVALTANAVAGDRARFLSVGFDGYLSKPIRKAPLIQAIHEMLASGDDHEQSQADPKPVSSGFDEQRFSEFLSERSEARALKLLGIFRTELKKHHDNILNAFETGNTHLLQHALHTIIGMSSSIGAIHLSDLARIHETACKSGKHISAEAITELSSEIETVLAQAKEALSGMEQELV